MVTCSIDDCTKQVFARGWCRNHWDYWRRNGDPLKRIRPRPLEARFWEKVAISDGCWEWNAYRQGPGYGIFAVGAGHRGKTVKAHRMAWTLTHGAIPEGMSVCHRCDNPPCVRPDHLFLATHDENMLDKAVKKRAYASPRDKNPAAKLTTEQVETIRKRYALGHITQAQLGREFGVTGAAVSYLVRK